MSASTSPTVRSPSQTCEGPAAGVRRGASAEEQRGLAALLGEIGEVREGDPVLATALGVGERGLVAVRPDGYIGLVADSPGHAALHDYLSRCLHTPATSRIP